MTLTDAFAPIIVLVLENLREAAEASGTEARQPAVPTAITQPSAGLVQPSTMLPLPGQPQSEPSTPAATSPSISPLGPRTEIRNTPADLAAQNLSTQLREEISSAHLKAIRNGIMQSDFDSALFAIAAWADEKLRAGKWPGSSRWNRYLLQKQYFETTTAGVEFFSRLEQIPRSNLQVREVFALCMALNFSGKYQYERDLRSLKELRSRTLQWSMPESDELTGSDLQLFPQAYPQTNPSAVKNTDKPGWALGFSRLTAGLIALPLIALIILSIAYYVSLAQMTANLEAKIL